MKKILCVIVFFLVSGFALYGQHEIVDMDTTGHQEFIVLKITGETALDKVLPARFLYAFDAFRTAKIIFKSGGTVASKVNINLLNGELLFIDASGTIMQVANQADIKMILISDDIWVPTESGFGKQVYDKNGITAQCVKRTEMSNYQVETAFGGKSTTSATQSLSSITSGNVSHAIIPVGEFTFTVTKQYYIAKGGKHRYANERLLKKMFRGHRKEIESFIKSNDLILQQEPDLIKALDYINTL